MRHSCGTPRNSGFEPAGEHVRALDQRGHLVEQRVVVDRLQPRRCGRSQLADDLGTALGKACDHRALAGHLLCVTISVGKRELGPGRFEAVAACRTARLQAQHADRHHIAAMQRHQAMRRAHEPDVAPAIGQLVGHDLGDRQLGQGLVECLLQAFGQGGARHQAVEKQGLGLAIGCALELRHDRRVRAQRGKLFQQGGRRLAIGSQGHGHRHQLLLHGAIGGPGNDTANLHGQTARRGEGRHRRIGSGQALRVQAGGQIPGKGLAELLQRLGRQFFDEQFNEQGVCSHGRSGRLLLVELSDDFVCPPTRREWEAQPRPAVEVTLCHGASQVANAADVGGPFGDADGTTCIQQVEGVAGLEQLLVSRQRELLRHQVLALLLMGTKGVEQEIDVAVLEVVGRLCSISFCRKTSPYVVPSVHFSL
jgi:hypothetical protein